MERDNAIFDTLQLSYIIYDGQDSFERRRVLKSMVESDPLMSNIDRDYEHHSDRYLRALKKGERLLEILNQVIISFFRFFSSYFHQI